MRDNYEKKENRVLVIVSVIFVAAIIIIAAVFLIRNVFKLASKGIGEKGVENEVVEEESADITVGDMVSYTPPVGTYTWLAKYSNADQDIEITNSNPDFQVTNWKVLNINDDGTVDLVSAKQTVGVVYLGNHNGYNNGVKLLNDLCEELYSDESRGIVGRSIAIEDIEKHLSETGKNTIKTYTNNYAKYGESNNTPYTENTLYPNIYPHEKYSKIDGNVVYNGLKLSEQEEFYEGTSEGETLQPTQTYWSMTHNYIMRAFEGENSGTLNRVYNVIIPNGGDTYYWIGSRCIQIFQNYVFYGIRYIAEGGVNAHWLYSSNNNEAYANYYIRPVVNVKKSLLKKAEVGYSI